VLRAGHDFRDGPPDLRLQIAAARPVGHGTQARAACRARPTVAHVQRQSLGRGHRLERQARRNDGWGNAARYRAPVSTPEFHIYERFQREARAASSLNSPISLFSQQEA